MNGKIGLIMALVGLTPSKLDEVRHGVDGWALETFEWSPATGVGHFTYGRTVGEEKKYEKAFVTRRQPAEPKHDGWRA